jgi:hypothetical protein
VMVWRQTLSVGFRADDGATPASQRFAPDPGRMI